MALFRRSPPPPLRRRFHQMPGCYFDFHFMIFFASAGRSRCRRRFLAFAAAVDATEFRIACRMGLEGRMGHFERQQYLTLRESS